MEEKRRRYFTKMERRGGDNFPNGEGRGRMAEKGKRYSPEMEEGEENGRGGGISPKGIRERKMEEKGRRHFPRMEEG
jgi:hypothetical protein